MTSERDDQYNVVQFFDNDMHEYVKRNVTLREAVEVAARCTRSVGARTGTVVKVIITDSGDDTNFMWEFGKGIVFPPEAAGRE